MSMKKIFLDHTAGKKIVCVFFEIWLYKNKKVFVLKKGYTEVELQEFLTSLEGYSDLFPEQTGIIWYSDGSWSTREYNEAYAEWFWDYNQCPEIPAVCIK